MFDRMKLFGKQKINKGKIANKIFDQAATPVLVLDKKQELLMANAAAKEFFDLGEEDANVTISSLFEITREDAKFLFDNIISGFLLINRDIIIINPTHITKILSICINPLSECPSKFFV